MLAGVSRDIERYNSTPIITTYDTTKSCCLQCNASPFNSIGLTKEIDFAVGVAYLLHKLRISQSVDTSSVYIAKPDRKLF